MTSTFDLSTWDASLDSPSSDKKKLYEELKTITNNNASTQQNNGNEKQVAQYWWRLSKAALVLSDIAAKNGNKADDKKYVFESLDYSKKALEADSSLLDSHKWYCAAVGRAAPFVGTKERIQYGHEFKKHSDIAVGIAPDDVMMHHMYGRWCYEVAGLTWMERKLAATFFGTPPEASYNDALEALTKAEKLKPIWKSNKLWMAKVYIALKNNADAIKYIDEGLAIENQAEEDFVAHAELVDLEKKYSKYRK